MAARPLVNGHIPILTLAPQGRGSTLDMRKYGLIQNAYRC